MKKLISVFASLFTLALPVHADGPTTREEMASFIDGVITGFMATENIPGAIVLIVKDGEIFFSKSYGYADYEKRVPIDPRTSMFKVASISKLFTFTGVMQLYERGILDLDADINKYLDLEIPNTFDEPITLKNLMTHTAGFEDVTYSYFTSDYERLIPLGDWLKKHLPKRVVPPGIYSTYSNYGAALAGYIIEKVSGLPFEEFMEKNILNPLQMDSSSFRQPLPLQLRNRLVQGYDYVNGSYKPSDLEVFSTAPNAALASTGVDMAKFMICHLQSGMYNGIRVLKEETADEMHGRNFGNSEDLNGMAYGFWERNSHNLRILKHDGSAENFLSDLILIPEKRIGYFLSFNCDDEAENARRSFFRVFLDHYFPTPRKIESRTIQQTVGNLGEYSGTYIPSRRSHTGISKLLLLLETVNISVDDDKLLVRLYRDMVFSKSSDDAFTEERLDDRIRFERDKGGKVAKFFLNSNPVGYFEKVGFLANPEVHIKVLIFCVLVFLGTLILKLLQFIFKRIYKIGGLAADKKQRIASILLLANSSLLLIFTILVAVILGAYQEVYSYGKASILYILLSLPVIAIPLLVLQIVFTIIGWKKKWWTVAYRLFYSFTGCNIVLFFLFLAQYNLIGFRL